MRPGSASLSVARMRALRGLDEMEELARRIDISVSQTLDAAQKEKFAAPVLEHTTATLQLPLSKISGEASSLGTATSG